MNHSIFQACPSHTQRIIRRGQRLTALVIPLLIAIQNGFCLQITNDYWITTNSATMNLGTLQEPFDGSTQLKFDSVVYNLPTNSVLHILPGTYTTIGAQVNGFIPKAGQKIIGSGIDVTKVQLQSGAGSGLSVISGGSCDKVEVSDMTIDCGPSNAGTVHGIILWGSKCAIRRVKVINANHDGVVSSESFCIAIVNVPGSNSEGNIIEECEVSQFRQGSCSGISLGATSPGWISGVIRNNRIFLNNAFDANINLAINCYNLLNSLIEANYVNTADYGFYGDTFTYTNVIVAHNMFLNVCNGVGIFSSIRENLSFIDNKITVTNAANGAGYGFLLWTAESIRSVLIKGNTVQYNFGDSVVIGYGIRATNVQHLEAVDNVFDKSMLNDLRGCTNVVLRNNRDFDGNVITNLPITGLPRRTVASNGTNQIFYSDEYVGVFVSGGIPPTLALPSAVTYPGKEYIFVDEKGSAASNYLITILPAGTEKVSGLGSRAIASAFGSYRVFSNGTNWFGISGTP